MRKKSERKAKTMWQTALCAAGVSLAAAITLAALIAALVLGGIVQQRQIEGAAVFAAGIGALAGAFYAVKTAEQKKLTAAALGAAVYAFVLLMGNLLFVDTPPVGIGRIGCACLGAAALASLIAARRPKRLHAARRR